MSDIPTGDPSHGLSDDYERARSQYDALTLQLGDVTAATGRLGDEIRELSDQQTLHEAVAQQARGGADPDLQAGDVAGGPGDRLAALRERLEEHEALQPKVAVDQQNAYQNERVLYWRDTIAIAIQAVAQGAGPPAGPEGGGRVRYESTTGGPDVIDGLNVQAEVVEVDGSKPIVARGPTRSPET